MAAKALSISVNLGKTTITWDKNPIDRVAGLALLSTPMVTLDPAPPGPAADAQWRLAQDMRLNGFVVNFRPRTLRDTPAGS
jgi:hypothetical protein